MRYLSILTLSLPPAFAQAYIPHSQTIVGRLVRNSGRGAYIIEQEVQFRTAGEPLVLREKWIVENGETMRLSVSSPTKGAEPVQFDAAYSGGRKVSGDPSQTGSAARATGLSPEFIEGFFHSRSTSGFLNALCRAKIVANGSFRDRPRFTKQGLETASAKYPPEPYVRLGRTSGVVTWIFGDPSPNQPARLNSAAWIEQDAFQLRRVRFPSEAEVSADKFTTYPNNLHFPRERTVSWGNNSVLIRVLSVKHVASAAGKESARPARLPELAQVKEFYSRFR